MVWKCVAVLCVCVMAVGAGAEPELTTISPRGKSFTVTTEPVQLSHGQVHNTFGKPVELPAEVRHKQMLITAYEADVVEFHPNGEVTSVPLSDCYLHHYGAILAKADEASSFYNAYTVPTGFEGFEPEQNAATIGLAAVYAGGRLPTTRALKRGVTMHNVHALFAAHTNRSHGGAAAGGGSGAEARRTSHAYPAPYGLVVDDVDTVLPLMHLIDTRGSAKQEGGYSKYAECPCTAARNIDVENETINGRAPLIPFHCNAALVNNTGCQLSTYTGGFRCCEHDVNVATPMQRLAAWLAHPSAMRPALFGMRFTFYYEPVSEAAVALRAPGCCDVTASLSHGGQIEYDVPRCAADTPREECVYTVVTYQYIDGPQSMFPHKQGGTPAAAPDSSLDDTAWRSQLVDLVYAVGHQHLGGNRARGIALFLNSTGELLCRSTPEYGTGAAAGNETGYVVGMSACVWGDGLAPGYVTLTPPPRLRRDAVVRVESSYDNTLAHTGVMSLFLMQVADVPPSSPETLTAIQ